MSGVEWWAARLVYLVLAPFVLVGGLLADLYAAMVRVVTTVCVAFGWDDPASASEAAVAFLVGAVCLAGLVLALPRSAWG